ncbi:DUF2252 family protein [Nannocystaceae bacterium ST9]
MPPSPGRLTPLLCVGLASACVVDPELARRGWLHDTLIRDNQVFLERSPELVAGKFAKMALGSYDYFRGSASQYGRDATEAGSPGYRAMAYLDEDAWDVALVGDPHPENLGTFLDLEGRVRVEFNDFDAATYGPWPLDVRRLALGFDAACRHVLELQADAETTPSESLVESDCLRWAEAATRGYVEQIAIVGVDPSAGVELREGEPELGVIVDELLADAREDGDAGSRLTDHTEIVADQRRFRLGAIEPPLTVAIAGFEVEIQQDTLVEASDADRELIDGLLSRYAETLEGPSDAHPLVLLDLARRLGAGVSSYAVPRYYLLFEGPSEAHDDDLLLEAKQLLDPLSLPGIPRNPALTWPDNGTRVISLQRALQAPGSDRWLGHATVGGMAIGVRHRSGYQRGFAVDRMSERLAEGDWTRADVEQFAGLAGALLAHAHARASKADGTLGGPAIARALADDREGFVRETLAFVADYGPRTAKDRQLLIELIAAHGLTLDYGSGIAP